MQDVIPLAQVGEWIIECGTAAELFARLVHEIRAGAPLVASRHPGYCPGSSGGAVRSRWAMK